MMAVEIIVDSINNFYTRCGVNEVGRPYLNGRRTCKEKLDGIGGIHDSA